MRIKHVVFVVFVFFLAPSAALPGQDGAFCTIPKLLPGVPAHVPVEHIDSPFCGVALVDGKMLDDATWKQAKVIVDLARLVAAKEPEMKAAYGL